MIIDFEATDASKEAEATQVGFDAVSFNEGGHLYSQHASTFGDLVSSLQTYCKPDRDISYGAMAVTHITPETVEDEKSHTYVVRSRLPKGEAYIIGHNVDFDLQVAANAGVDTSEYKAICTLALAKRIIPDSDSYTLGALIYQLYPDRARTYLKRTHSAGWDVTFTRWLLEHLYQAAGITSMEQLYLASEAARTPTAFDFGKHKGRNIKDLACHAEHRKYFDWIFDNIDDKPYLIKACQDAVDGIRLLNWRSERGGLPCLANIDNGDSYRVHESMGTLKTYTAIKMAGEQQIENASFDTVNDAKAWCVKLFNIGLK